jgi:hypothetical protein
MSRKIGFDLTQVQAIEATFVAKGGYKTNGKDEFSVDTYYQWLLQNKPFLRPYLKDKNNE